MAKLNGSVSAGILARGQMRRALETIKLKGHLDRYVEIKGFLDSSFYLYGISDIALKSLREWMEETSHGQ